VKVGVNNKFAQFRTQKQGIIKTLRRTQQNGAQSGGTIK
jgi:hypothetical protein